MITKEQRLVLDIMQEIANLSPEYQAYTHNIAGKIRELVNDHGVYGLMALALIGAEKQL